MIKQTILILVLVTGICLSSGIEITIDTEISDEEDNYHKYKMPSNDYPEDIHKYQDVEYNLIKVPEPYRYNEVNKGYQNRKPNNQDIRGFLHKLRKVVRHGPRKGAGQKPIFRKAITLIANSAEKDHKYGKKKLVTKIVPKMYMPVPQAISHILGKEHMPSGVYDNLAQSYNYRAK